MRKILMTAFLGTLLLGVGIGTAQAQPVAPARTWQVSHGTASASGTTTSNYPMVQVSGQLTNTSSDCYYVEFMVTGFMDSYPLPSNSQCGPGTLPLNFSVYQPLAITAQVCKGAQGYPYDCGPAQQVF
jgi:hypothetical protein